MDPSGTLPMGPPMQPAKRERDGEAQEAPVTLPVRESGMFKADRRAMSTARLGTRDEYVAAVFFFGAREIGLASPKSGGSEYLRRTTPLFAVQADAPESRFCFQLRGWVGWGCRGARGTSAGR